MRPADWSPVGLDGDPTPGDPVLVLSGGQDYLEVAGSIDDAAGAMSRLDVAGTISQAVDALMETKEETVGEIRRAHARYQATGEALVDYARALERVQAETLAALERARQAQEAAQDAAGSRDRFDDLADGASDAQEKQEYEQQARAAGSSVQEANGRVAAARSDIETASADRDRAAGDAVARIEDITSGDDLNDSWWDDWGSKVVAAIADIADMVSMIAGLLAVVVAFIPVVGTALAGVLIVVAAVAAIVSALANITLAATGERSWAEAGIAIAGAALSVIGLGGAAKAATGLSRVAVKQGMKTGAKKAWCKVGFGTCFTAGTLVRTADGDRPIEDLRAGDKVWAHDVAAGGDGWQVVTETFVRTTTTLYHLSIGGHTVTTTDEHPFMVANMGWILARDLQPGDLLVTPDGTVTLERVTIDQRGTDDAVTVYNIHVETHHTYYVLAGDLPVLVHNAVHAKALKPGTTYKIKGGTYQVDDLGRPSGIRVKLTKSDIGGATDPKVDPLGYIEGVHQRGHLRGANLGGPNDHAANFVAQHPRSNSPWQRAVEREVKRVVNGGEDVDYRVTPQYEGNAEVPSRIHFQADGDNGYRLDYTLDNRADLPLLSDEVAAGNLPKNEHGFRFGTRS
ncbi:polymorphic toxin-type HINT domain-containing protein [Isoptericola sp. 4D.3]|uniref:Polymorphic toxin-type HINT domain-containing protein n=1 Tax=Isoptericola peretonis TaxID=2918523 RepID=A0ABT0J8N7_9MICO|nr:polymorphic toxin-type HINT domain-containing protein [Isoptericola sp. 4D.3]